MKAWCKRFWKRITTPMEPRVGTGGYIGLGTVISSEFKGGKGSKDLNGKTM